MFISTISILIILILIVVLVLFSNIRNNLEMGLFAVFGSMTIGLFLNLLILMGLKRDDTVSLFYNKSGEIAP